MDIVQFLSPPVVLLGLENVVLVVVGKYVVEVFVLVKNSARIVLLLEAIGLSLTKFAYFLQACIACLSDVQNPHHVLA